MGEAERTGSLDAIARDLATGAISRRTALKRFAAAGLAAAIPGGLFASSAFAKCPQSRRCAGTCCPNHAHCVHGKCKCRRGFTKCGTHCRDLQTDPKNCGKCGHKCPAGESCRNGHCKPPAECQGVNDCPQPGNPECATATCTGGHCGFDFTQQGTPVASQTSGDCQKNVCNGSGQIVTINDDTDLPAGGQCLQAACINGVPQTTPLPVSTPCNENGGVHCDGFGSCVQATCINGIQDGDETDVDCGGPTCAQRCGTGQSCLQNSDCQSGVCTGSVCVQASCADLVKNGDETDVDCGGSCQKCANGKNCNSGGDCQSGHRDVQRGRLDPGRAVRWVGHVSAGVDHPVRPISL